MYPLIPYCLDRLDSAVGAVAATEFAMPPAPSAAGLLAILKSVMLAFVSQYARFVRWQSARQTVNEA